MSATAAEWKTLNLPSRPVTGVGLPVNSSTSGASTEQYRRPLARSMIQSVKIGDDDHDGDVFSAFLVNDAICHWCRAIG
jgi:hypothetical protein